MSNTELFSSENHLNVLLEDHCDGTAIQANQHLIIHGNSAMLLDPGGHKVFAKVRADVFAVLKGRAKLTDLFLSHQDPDICAALNGWLMSTDAKAHIPTLWSHFIAHFGVDRLVSDRIVGLADKGRWVDIDGCQVALIPAHFLHSCGNFQVYDPHSKILYSGDLGASLGQDYIWCEDFENHLQYMTGFHRRYMPSTRALKGWAAMVREMDIEMIAPQHGALFKGKEMVKRFIDWIDQLDVGLDHMTNIYRIPPKG